MWLGSVGVVWGVGWWDEGGVGWMVWAMFGGESVHMVSLLRLREPGRGGGFISTWRERVGRGSEEE